VIDAINTFDATALTSGVTHLRIEEKACIGSVVLDRAVENATMMSSKLNVRVGKKPAAN
jgi:hypothetical protein